MHKYDYGKISSNLPSDILRLIGFIREAKTKDLYRKSQYMREYEDILSIAKVASVKFSNAIENIVSTDERIRELVVRGGRPLNHSEEEIAGYGVALDIIHSEPLNVEKATLHRLHSVIRAGLPDERGRFKTRDNVIAEIDAEGNTRVVLRTVRFQDVETNIDAMIDAYLLADTDGVEPLLLIPCIIVDYLCIHPYMDGNGRTSRLLTYLLL